MSIAAGANVAIKPWIEVAALHPDVLPEHFSEDIFALEDKAAKMAILIPADWLEDRLDSSETLVLDPRRPVQYLQGHIRNAEELAPEIRRKSEKAAKDIVVAWETARGWECQRVGHEKRGFDIRSLGPADPLEKPDREPLRIQNPAKHLDHAKREVVAAPLL